MKKLLLFATAVLFLTRCNTTQEQKPDAERAIKDTFAQNMMQPFNAKPASQRLYASYEPRDKDVPRAQSAAIRHLLSSIKAQPQHFVIGAAEQNELQGEQGTKVSIEPNIFVTKSGKEVSSAIAIELKECYDMGEMLEENLTTSGNGKAMESKGAVFVSASCNGEEVQLKEGQKINIQFPFAVNGNDGYLFYYGNNDQNSVSWTPVNEESETPATKDIVTKPEFSFKGYSLKEYLTSQLEYTDEARRNELSTNVAVSFVVDRNGKAKDIVCTSAYKTFRDEIVATLQQMPKWKPATYGKHKINAQVKLNIDFNLRRKNQVVVEFNSGNITPLAKNVDYGSTEAVYSETFDRLGWISNCRLVESPQAKADVVIGSNANSDIKLVFKNRKVILGGHSCLGYTRFNHAGTGEEIYVLAVRNEGGNIFYALQPVVLQKQTVVTLNWKRGDEEEIKKLYRSLS